MAGNDTIINMEPGHENRETASANLDTQIHSVEGEAADRAEGYKIEIIKSIVFGGLAESITSLSIVSSATGGDTTTCKSCAQILEVLSTLSISSTFVF